MLGAGRRWYVSLEQIPGQLTVARFGTSSRGLGHQIWDEVGWPMPLTEPTETFILSEIYAATLAFWEVRR